MVFIGNGFDIAVLKKYGKGITTSYDSFYAFFKYKYPDNNNNLLIEQMEKPKRKTRKTVAILKQFLIKHYFLYLRLTKNRQIN
jgi:hypothetical protein